VAHARVAKLELALELGGSVAVEDEELECVLFIIFWHRN